MITDNGYSYFMWGLFILFTLGTVDFDVEYDDGFHIRYRSWLDNLIEKVNKCM